jgi:hypothetical protein
VPKRAIVTLLSAVLWGAFLYLGISLCNDVAQQKAPGYPNSGQWAYYVYFPAAMVALSACLTVFVNRTPKPVFYGLWSMQLVLMLAFLFGYTGGV